MFYALTQRLINLAHNAIIPLNVLHLQMHISLFLGVVCTFKTPRESIRTAAGWWAAACRLTLPSWLA